MLIDQNDLVNNMDKDMVKALAMATSAGLTFLFCIGGFIWIGYKLDGYHAIMHGYSWINRCPNRLLYVI